MYHPLHLPTLPLPRDHRRLLPDLVISVIRYAIRIQYDLGIIMWWQRVREYLMKLLIL